MKKSQIEDYKSLIATLEKLWVIRKAEPPHEQDGAKLELLNLICHSRWHAQLRGLKTYHGWLNVWRSFDGSKEQFMETMLGFLSKKTQQAIKNNLLEIEEDEI